LSSAASDALDGLGLRLAVPVDAIGLIGPAAAVVGRAITLRYLPARSVGAGPPEGRLAHRTLFELAEPGDVAVISAPPQIDASVLGGEALAAARDAGLAGMVVDGSVRDIDELVEVGLPVWAARRTQVTGRGRLEAVEINGPLAAAGVRVEAGDIVIADVSGICFVPADRFDAVARRILGPS
jgi:regulator of RNase E activity RraA